jgi:hypothetical protein
VLAAHREPDRACANWPGAGLKDVEGGEAKMSVSLFIS